MKLVLWLALTIEAAKGKITSSKLAAANSQQHSISGSSISGSGSSGSGSSSYTECSQPHTHSTHTQP